MRSKSRQISDCYMLALAVLRGDRLVTFDRRIVPARWPGAGYFWNWAKRVFILLRLVVTR